MHQIGADGMSPMHAGVVQVGPAGATLCEQVIFALVEHRPVDVAQKASLEREMKLRPIRFVVQRIGGCAEACHPGDPQAAAPQSRTCHGSRSSQVCLSRFRRPFDRTSGILHTPRRAMLRARYRLASSSPTNCSCCGSQRSFRFSRVATSLNWQTMLVRWPISTGVIGSCRLFTQSRKFRTCAGLASRKTSAW